MDTKNSNFEQMGFLSSSIAAGIPMFTKTFNDWKKLYYDLNEYAHNQKSILQTKVRSRDVKALLIYCCFYRILISYQSIYLLIERGNSIDSRALLRNLIENLFVLSATIEDETFTNDYIVVDKCKQDRNRKAILEYYHKEKKNNVCIMSDNEAESLTQRVREYKEKYKQTEYSWTENKEKNTTIEKIAARAKLSRIYTEYYLYLCSYTHSSPSGMIEFLQIGKDGSIEAIRTGCDDSNAYFIMKTAIKMLLEGLRKISNFSGVCISDELSNYYQRSIQLPNPKSKPPSPPRSPA